VYGVEPHDFVDSYEHIISPCDREPSCHFKCLFDRVAPPVFGKPCQMGKRKTASHKQPLKPQKWLAQEGRIKKKKFSTSVSTPKKKKEKSYLTIEAISRAKA